MVMFNWWRGGDGEGRRPSEEEKKRMDAKARPEQIHEEDLPELSEDDLELVQDEDSGEDEEPVIARQKDLIEHLDLLDEVDVAFDAFMRAVSARKKAVKEFGELDSKTREAEYEANELADKYRDLRERAVTSSNALHPDFKDLILKENAATKSGRIKLRESLPAEEAPPEEEDSVPEIEEEDDAENEAVPEEESVLEEETPDETGEVKDARWFGGLRDSVSRFVKRHTTGAVDQREEGDLSKLQKKMSGAGQLAEGLLGGVASVAGVKIAYDITLGLSQEYFTRSEREALIAHVQDQLRGIESVNGEREGNEDLATRFSAIESRIDSSEHLSGAQKRELKEKLGAIIDEDNVARHAAYRDRDDQVRALFEEAIKARLKGNSVIRNAIDVATSREALNTAMAATGIVALRGGVMLGLSAAEAYRAASKELRDTEEEYGFRDVVQKAFADSWTTYAAEMSGEKGGWGVARGAAKTVRVVGFGAMAASGIAGASTAEQIENFLNNWSGDSMGVNSNNLENAGSNIAASADRATLGLGGMALDRMFGGEIPAGEIPAGISTDVPMDIPQESYVDASGTVSERPASGYEFSEGARESSSALESAGVAPAAFEAGSVRAGDGISQAIARQIDIMPESQFKELAERYGFTGEREFKTGILATGENRSIPEGSLLDNERYGAYKKFIARVTRDIVRDNEAYATEQGFSQEGFSDKAWGNVSAVLVPDGNEPSGFGIKYFTKDGNLLELENSEYSREGNWGQGVDGGNAGREGAAGAVEAGESEAGESISSQIFDKTVYKVGGKVVTFGDAGQILLDGENVGSKLDDIPEGDNIRQLMRVRGDIWNITAQIYEAGDAGDMEKAQQLFGQLKELEEEAGTWGYIVDIPNSALDGLQAKYDLATETPEPAPTVEAVSVETITLEREGGRRPVDITFEYDDRGRVTGADISKFRVMGKELTLAKEEASEALGIDLEAASRPRTLIPDLKRHYILSRLEEALETGGKSRSAEATWVRKQLKALYETYHPEKVG